MGRLLVIGRLVIDPSIKAIDRNRIKAKGCLRLKSCIEKGMIFRPVLNRPTKAWN